MQYVTTLLFYTFSCSLILVYGIGLEKTFFESRPHSRFPARIPGLFIDAIMSVAALWFPVTRILLPYGYFYLVPMAVILVCGIVHLIVSVLLPPVRKVHSGERLFFFGMVFLALSEPVSFPDALLIVCAGIVSFGIMTVLLFAIRERISAANVHPDWKGAPLVLLSMGLLFIVLYSADVSWWLSEAVR